MYFVVQAVFTFKNVAGIQTDFSTTTQNFWGILCNKKKKKLINKNKQSTCAHNTFVLQSQQPPAGTIGFSLLLFLCQINSNNFITVPIFI